MHYFLDCEFDGFRGPLISLALVAQDGRHFYGILTSTEAKNPWVVANVLPVLHKQEGGATGSDSANFLAEVLALFLRGDDRPHVVADHPADLEHLMHLVGTEANGHHVLYPIRISFELRFDLPGTSGTSRVPHNALEDARALRESYLATIRQVNLPPAHKGINRP